MSKEVICNMCGQTCCLVKFNNENENGGLINCEVTGGYSSTAGNGYGAFDDYTKIKFSLCEFCLDFIFSICEKKPMELNFVYGNPTLEEEYVPSIQRVFDQQEWRKDSSGIFAKRFNSRNKVIENNFKKYKKIINKLQKMWVLK